MNWKARFRELTGWRSKNDEERTTNDEERLKIFAKSPTEMSRKRYGSTSAWIFFTETIFLTNFKRILNSKRAERNYSALFPLFIGEKREVVATQLVQASLACPGGPGCYLHIPFLLNTPFCFFFGDSLSVMLQNFTNFVTILVFFP